MEIGSIIRSRRAARGLTQAQVAQALGVTATAVSKWERNASLPEITLLPALARLLEPYLEKERKRRGSRITKGGTV